MIVESRHEAKVEKLEKHIDALSRQVEILNAHLEKHEIQIN